MNDSTRVKQQLCAVAGHLASRREAILSQWRRAVDLDAESTTASTITRSQFVDHIPAVLDAFERRLCAEDDAERAQARADQSQEAAEHGLHRWQQGYDLTQTMYEWGHLHMCLLQELDSYGAAHPRLAPSVMPAARRALVRLCSDGVCASAARYTRLQQTEAASRMRDLEGALDQLKALASARAGAWREAAHDLRGSAHVIANASAALKRAGVPDPKRMELSEILSLGVASLNNLLTDLMDHARLEAGREQRKLTDLDAASVLREFCETMRPLAIGRNLFLRAEGPRSLPVEGDAAKIQRIAQNLVLNALKVTKRGGITLSWEEGGTSERPQWTLCVQDTGPGFKAGSAAPIEHALKHATNRALEVEERAQVRSEQSAMVDQPAALRPDAIIDTGALPPGEGIGLSIVKRLCELLDASLALETEHGKGTTVRVIFPRRYPDRARQP